MFPQASRVLGIDLSPHMLAIGKFLIEEVSTPAPGSGSVSGSIQSRTEEEQKPYSDFEWVDRIEEDSRIEFLYSDLSHTELPSGKAPLNYSQ